MPKLIDRQDLYRHWIHSHEEDSATERVYRPAGYAFPPSRGRTGFELRPDGSLVEAGIAATDGLTHSDGSWRLENDRLEFYSASASEPQRILQIRSLDKQRLVVTISSVG